MLFSGEVSWSGHTGRKRQNLILGRDGRFGYIQLVSLLKLEISIFYCIILVGTFANVVNVPTQIMQ